MAGRQLLNYSLNLVSSILMVLALTGCDNFQSNKLLIATAANGKFTVEEIADNFEQEFGVPTEVIISSSGKHTAQIEAGAPYDVFLSADLKFPQRLFDNGITLDAPRTYAYGKLILWTASKDITPNPELLKNPTIKYIAMANPETAPYGKAAAQVLTSLGYYRALSEKLVYGESVAQATQYIRSGSATIGFTASSVVHTPENKKIGRWIEIDQGLYEPIAQGVVVVKSSSQLENAKKFYLYLFSPEAQNVFRKFGYQVDKDQ